jgi:hypothetical protein
MTDTIRVGESGKRHRINCKFDMSSNTSIGFVYTKPVTGSTLTVSGVLGTTAETIDGVAAAANTWAYYDFVPGDVDEAGAWDLQITYTNTASTPDDVFKNLDAITLTVGD